MRAIDKLMRAIDRPEEKRILCHSQGYDLMERPGMRIDDTNAMEKRMNIGCRSAYAYDGMYIWFCERFILGEDDPEPVHKLPAAAVT